eukprot:GHVR01032047.1.p1 GENE.GHVR01032047.1~~GHVR01032047.1.p1  ORF type:complete len:243 (-),score=26.75 GHVR01032047.1:150-878(-)
MNRRAQDLISPREILRQHRTGRTLRGAEQLRARERGFRQAHEPAGFLDAVAAALLPTPPVVGRGDDPACTAIGERHGRCEPDLVAFLVVWNRRPIPAALAPVLGVAVRVFQVGEELDQPKGSTRFVRASTFLHVLVASAAVIVSGEEDSPERDGVIRIGHIGRVFDSGAVEIGDPCRRIPGGGDLAGLDQFGSARVALEGAEPCNFRLLIRVGFNAAVGVEKPSHYAALRSSISMSASSGTR